jgi:methyltransferase
LLALVTAEWLAELWLARCNTAALLAKGAFEVAPGHYPLIVLLHAVWLLGLWLIGWADPLSRIWLVIFLALQGLRAWVLLTLGRRWTTRIVVLPGAPLQTAPIGFCRIQITSSSSLRSLSYRAASAYLVMLWSSQPRMP